MRKKVQMYQKVWRKQKLSYKEQKNDFKEWKVYSKYEIQNG